MEQKSLASRQRASTERISDPGWRDVQTGSLGCGRFERASSKALCSYRERLESPDGALTSDFHVLVFGGFFIPTCFSPALQS